MGVDKEVRIEDNHLASKQASKQASRNSSIELLKIIAIFIIVISHVIQTLNGADSCIEVNEYIIDLNLATLNMQQLVLSMFRYFGVLGNTIFFVASAWFLLDSDNWSKKKELSLAMDVWIVSVIILIAMEIAQVEVSSTLIVKSLFPNIFANNWYITCYLLFYPIHGLINGCINHIEQKSLLRLCLSSGVLYMCINFLKGDLLFPSRLIYWTVIYLFVAYGKFYLPQLMNSRKANAFLLVLGLGMNTLLIVLTNFLGVHSVAFSNKLLRWSSNINPFFVFAAIGAFNLARLHVFHNKFINYISGCSLLIYIIHENILVRSYLRPAIWQWIYENGGYTHIVLWVVELSFIFFIISAVLAVVYRTTFGNLLFGLKNALFKIIKKEYRKVERKFLSFK